MDQIKKEIQAKLTSAKTLEELNNLKVEYLGKKGIITELNSKIKEIPNEEKKYVIKYYMSGINAIIIEWIKGGCIEEIQFIANLIAKYVYK